MSRAELKTLVDRCTKNDRRFLLACLRTKDPEYQRKLSDADRELAAGRSVRLRVTRQSA